MTTRIEAARARAAGVAQRSHRPSQRRAAEAPASRAFVKVPAQIELRDTDSGAGLLHFVGQASVYERGYEMWDMFGPYTEVVSANAAADLERADLDVPLVLAHDSLRRIARTTNGTLGLTQDERALHVDAPALDPADHDVAYIAPKIRAGLIDEMSFMFRITSGQWSPDYEEFRINAFEVHRGDVAIVGYGANPHTAEGTDLRASAPRDDSRVRALLELALAE